MPPSSIHQSLHLLLPSHQSKLPPSLIHLSESLLAQSRQRASNLKPEEEIARAHACCEIACKRLRAQCRLPAVKSGGAPCKPAVYKKLVGFLERVLDGDGNGGGTALTTPGSRTGKKRRADGSVVKTGGEALNVSNGDESVTPTKSSRNSSFVGKIQATNTTSLADQGIEAPKFTMPSIRKLCNLFETPLLAPHVYTGTCIVLKLAGVWPSTTSDDTDADTTQHTRIPSTATVEHTVTGLLIALYLMTLTKMQIAKMTITTYTAVCQRSVKELRYPYGQKGVEEWIRCINRDGYIRDQEWWESVPKDVFDFDYGGAQLNDEDVADQSDGDEVNILSTQRKRLARSGPGGRRGADVTTDEQEDDPEGVLLPGLATMMQDAVDFLSDERTQAFELWKKAFMRKLDRLDKTARTSSARAVAVK